jgi:predicted protein tyrosine phosphatase
MIKIHVHSEREVAGQNLLDLLVISIVSPGREHPKIIGTNIHKFNFHDVTEEYFLENQNRIVRPMEKEIAESIVEIAMDNKDCDRWVIHCEAGISRSPGVAIGLSSFFKTIPNEEKLKELFPCYNKHVANLVKEALSRKMGEMFMNTYLEIRKEEKS